MAKEVYLTFQKLLSISWTQFMNISHYPSKAGQKNKFIIQDKFIHIWAEFPFILLSLTKFLLHLSSESKVFSDLPYISIPVGEGRLLFSPTCQILRKWESKERNNINEFSFSVARIKILFLLLITSHVFQVLFNRLNLSSKFHDAILSLEGTNLSEC